MIEKLAMLAVVAGKYAICTVDSAKAVLHDGEVARNAGAPDLLSINTDQQYKVITVSFTDRPSIVLEKKTPYAYTDSTGRSTLYLNTSDSESRRFILTDLNTWGGLSGPSIGVGVLSGWCESPEKTP